MFFLYPEKEISMPKRMAYSAITGAVLFVFVLLSKPEIQIEIPKILFGAVIMAVVSSAGGSLSFLLKKAYENKYIPQLLAKVLSLVGFVVFAMAGFLLAFSKVGGS